MQAVSDRLTHVRAYTHTHTHTIHIGTHSSQGTFCGTNITLSFQMRDVLNPQILPSSQCSVEVTVISLHCLLMSESYSLALKCFNEWILNIIWVLIIQSVVLWTMSVCLLWEYRIAAQPQLRQIWIYILTRCSVDLAFEKYRVRSVTLLYACDSQ